MPLAISPLTKKKGGGIVKLEINSVPITLHKITPLDQIGRGKHNNKLKARTIRLITAAARKFSFKKRSRAHGRG